MSYFAAVHWESEVYFPFIDIGSSEIQPKSACLHSKRFEDMCGLCAIPGATLTFHTFVHTHANSDYVYEQQRANLEHTILRSVQLKAVQANRIFDLHSLFSIENWKQRNVNEVHGESGAKALVTHFTHNIESPRNGSHAYTEQKNYVEMKSE